MNQPPTGPDDLDGLLQQRFATRAAAATPSADPGPAILERAARIQRVTGRRRAMVTIAVVAMIAAATALVVTGHHGTPLRTANGSTTTTVAGCAVSGTCQPRSVSVVVVGAVPPSYVRAAGSLPARLNGQHVVELTYTSTAKPSGGTGTGGHRLVVRVTTSSARDADALAQQVQHWSVVRVGLHPARSTTVVQAPGTAAQLRVGYLQVRLSPTVTLSMYGEGLTSDQLVEVALSITVR